MFIYIYNALHCIDDVCEIPCKNVALKSNVEQYNIKAMQLNIVQYEGDLILPLQLYVLTYFVSLQAWSRCYFINKLGS